MTATGSLTTKIKIHPDKKAGKSTISRMSVETQFLGDLQAFSKGYLLSVGGEIRGSAGFVAIERVTGILAGRRGTFALQHFSTKRRGAPGMSVSVVVPDSGTGELTGLTGQMDIRVMEAKYKFEYSLLE